MKVAFLVIAPIKRNFFPYNTRNVLEKGSEIGTAIFLCNFPYVVEVTSMWHIKTESTFGIL